MEWGWSEARFLGLLVSCTYKAFHALKCHLQMVEVEERLQDVLSSGNFLQNNCVLMLPYSFQRDRAELWKDESLSCLCQLCESNIENSSKLCHSKHRSLQTQRTETRWAGLCIKVHSTVGLPWGQSKRRPWDHEWRSVGLQHYSPIRIHTQESHWQYKLICSFTQRDQDTISLERFPKYSVW